MSFAFYLNGWSGITVEPNPWLARLSRAVRPRDVHLEAVVGAASGETTFYLIDDFHGLSTAIESHARSAQTQFGKSSRRITVPVTTLAELCATHAPTSFDFLKIDVEGAEKDVLFGGDWQNYRPKVVVAEALAPYTLAPAWPEWEPFLAQHGYRYVLFDSLNRYYLAEEANELAACFATAPAAFEDAVQFRNVKPALADETHPDHRLATAIARTTMTRLPLCDRRAPVRAAHRRSRCRGARKARRCGCRRPRRRTAVRAPSRAGMDQRPEASRRSHRARPLRGACRNRSLSRRLRPDFRKLCLVAAPRGGFGLRFACRIRYTA